MSPDSQAPGRLDEVGSRAVGPVTVVTDSTAYLPPQLVLQHGIRVVPLQIVIGGVPRDEAVAAGDSAELGDSADSGDASDSAPSDSHSDSDPREGEGEQSGDAEGAPGEDAAGDPVGPGAVAEALRHWVPVSTSRPAPALLAAAYAEAAAAGAGSVVSVHLSGRMSGTVDAAVVASGTAPVPVRVVDSGTLGMGLGFAALAAAEVAARGGSMEEAAEAAQRRAGASATYFYVDTLEHLRRGGRLGAAAKLLGSALAVKPLLHVVDGVIEPLEKVRTSARAVGRLEEIVLARARDAEVDIAVHHLAAPERAARLAERLRGRLPGLKELYVGEAGAVVGAHTGPGMLAVVVAPR